LHARACSWDHGCDDNSEETAEAEAVAADIVSGRQTDMFWFDEAVFEGTTLPGDEGKDHLMYPPTTVITARRLQVEGAFRADESARTPPRNQDHQADDAEKLKQKQPDEAKGIAVDVGPAVPVPDQRDVQVVTSSEENVSVEGNHLMMILCFSSSSVRLFFLSDTWHHNLVAADEGKESRREEEDARCDADDEHANETDEGFSEGHGHDVKLFVNNRVLADTRKLLLDAGGGGARLLQDEKDRDSSRFGASTLTSESTSKSSVEWQSSTVAKDSETEYPFSSSSRRSSARWESYALFRRYDEDMVYFHRVGAQKLTETGTLKRLINKLLV
jgi:hypothetical protein